MTRMDLGYSPSVMMRMDLKVSSCDKGGPEDDNYKLGATWMM